MTDWHFGYQFNTPIVGESNYQKALTKSYKDPNAFVKGESAFVECRFNLRTKQSLR